MQIGFVNKPLISRHKVVERQWARSTRALRDSLFFVPFLACQGGALQEAAVKDVTPRSPGDQLPADMNAGRISSMSELSCAPRPHRPRCVGPQRAGHFGLRAHVDTTDARSTLDLSALPDSSAVENRNLDRGADRAPGLCRAGSRYVWR